MRDPPIKLAAGVAAVAAVVVAWIAVLAGGGGSEGGTRPHIHQLAQPKVLDAVRRCRLQGRGIDFTGRAKGPVPRLAQ